MIIVDKRAADLAAGQALIENFLDTMRSEWLPGFERSYQRRSQEYQEALQKYEKRGLFLRTLLRKPKQPHRMPARYPGEVESRLREGWQDSWRAARDKSTGPGHLWLHEDIKGDCYILSDLQLQADIVVPLVAINSAGLLITTSEDGRAEQSTPTVDADTHQSAAIIKELLQDKALREVPFYSAAADWQSNHDHLMLEKPLIFELLDTLLSRHQEYKRERTFSAQKTAAKLAEREKYNLLKMAANL